MTDNQPNALRLADALDTNIWEGKCGSAEREAAAAELRRLHAENDKLKTALRRVIRTYMVADDAWDPDAELERLYQWEMKK